MSTVYVPIEYLDELNEKLDRVLAELDAMRMPKSLSVGTGEAAKMLNVSARTIREWQRNGKMPKLVSTEGQNYLWSREAIERMAEGKQKGGRPRRVA